MAVAMPRHTGQGRREEWPWQCHGTRDKAGAREGGPGQRERGPGWREEREPEWGGGMMGKSW